MALPLTGPIKFSDINVELGLTPTLQISLGSVISRTLLGVPAGAIRLAADGRGKSNVFAVSITSNQKELNLRTWLLANGWDGIRKVIVTVNPNVYIWSDNVAVPALTINGSWPNGVEIINNGYIMGRGGDGAMVGSDYSSSSVVYFKGQNGGPAITLGTNVTISSTNGYIGGGGGGGNGFLSTIGSTSGPTGGGGAGGGKGGNGNYSNGAVPGPIGGLPGQPGSSYSGNLPIGGSGGRIMPGTTTPGVYLQTNNANRFLYPGTGGTGGGSGGIYNQKINAGYYGTSGSGGGANQAGGTAASYGAVNAGGGGGGWGASGGNTTGSPNVGLSSGGAAISLNGFVVTWSGGFPASRVFGAVA